MCLETRQCCDDQDQLQSPSHSACSRHSHEQQQQSCPPSTLTTPAPHPQICRAWICGRSRTSVLEILELKFLNRIYLNQEFSCKIIFRNTKQLCKFSYVQGSETKKIIKRNISSSGQLLNRIFARVQPNFLVIIVIKPPEQDSQQYKLARFIKYRPQLSSM